MADALWFDAPRSVEIRSEDVRDPEAGEARVRALCGLVSAGSEMNIYRGEADLPDPGFIPNVEGTLPFPVKFGYQEVARVEAVGDDVALNAGDLVFCMHPHQSEFTLNQQFVSRVPAGIPADRAVFAGLFSVALNLSITTPPLIGDCVVVSGLGVVGDLAAYLARLTASQLILVDPSEGRRERAGWIGADAVVSPDEVGDVVADLSRGRGADLFIEASGAAAALQLALAVTGMEGTITVTSWYGSRPVPLRMSPEFHLRRHKIVSTGPTMPPHLTPRWDMDRVREVTWEHLRKIDVADLLISDRVAFGEGAEAYRRVDDPEIDTLAVLLEHVPDT